MAAKRALGRCIGVAFDLITFAPGVRWLVSHRRYESIFRSVCAKQEPLEGWPATMSIWERWRLLGHALQNNCNCQPPLQGSLGLRVLREQKRPAARRAQAAAAAAPQPGTLRVFSQNMWLSHFLGGPSRAERLRLLVDHLEDADYDVCVFQELFSFGLGPVRLDAECRWLEAELRARGFTFSTCAVVAKDAPLLGQDAGLQAFSRLPLEEIEVSRFSNCRALSQKVRAPQPSRCAAAEKVVHFTV